MNSSVVCVDSPLWTLIALVLTVGLVLYLGGALFWKMTAVFRDDYKQAVKQTGKTAARRGIILNSLKPHLLWAIIVTIYLFAGTVVLAYLLGEVVSLIATNCIF